MVFDNRSATKLKADEYPKCRNCHRQLFARFFTADGDDYIKGIPLAIAGHCGCVDVENPRYGPDKELSANPGGHSTFQAARALRCGVCGTRILVMYDWNEHLGRWFILRGICGCQPGWARTQNPEQAGPEEQQPVAQEAAVDPGAEAPLQEGTDGPRQQEPDGSH